MFIKILIQYVLGYVRITVEGYYVERFINICSNQKILVWNLKREKGTKLYLNVGIKDFKKLISVSKKTQCKLKVIRKKGIPFLLNRYRKRKIFLILLFVVFFFVFASSKYVWNIEIKVENGGELENIMQDINSAGLEIGMRKSSVDTKEIINKLRLERKDISWAGIELDGTNVIVKIVKAKEAPELVDENDYCSIVADKKGIITKIIALNGTAKVKVGDEVEKGTVLISGTMEGKYTGIRYVHSMGEIEAIVPYEKSIKINLINEEKEETGKKENKYKIKFNNFQINLFKTLSKSEIYDTIETEKKFKIFSNIYLPISITKIENKEMKKVQKQYSKEEATNLGINELKARFENEKFKNVIDTKLEKIETEDYVEVKLTYEVLENIGTQEKVETIEETKINEQM